MILPSRSACRRFFEETLPSLHPQEIDQLAEALKDRVVQNLWTDIPSALYLSNLILDLAKCTGNDLHRALGLRARAQTLTIGLGEHRKAMRVYRQALAIHRKNQDRLGQAMVMITSIWAMANLGQYRQAIRAGEWCGQVLSEYRQWRPFATLQNNLAAIHNRSWDFQQALRCSEEADRVYRQVGQDCLPYLANNEVNRAVALCNLGRFQESLQASQAAMDLAQTYDQKIVLARAQHNLAITQYLMGKYTQALDLLLKAHQAHTAAGQPNEAALCELSATDCLLQLNRVEAALEKCQQILPVFTGLGMRLEAAEAAHYQAVAYLRMDRAEGAIAALQTVRSLFAAEGMPHWVAYTDLEAAQVYLSDRQFQPALEIARRSCADLEALGLPYETVQAQLVMAEALLEAGDLQGARSLVETNLAIVIREDWPALAFQANYLLGRCLLAGGQGRAALAQYTQAIEIMDRLRSQIILEYRASFLSRSESIYQEIVALCLDGENDPKLALDFAERARTRAILELLSGKADLSLRARQPADEPLIQKIGQLRNEREQLVRRLDTLSLDLAPRVDEESQRLQEKVIHLEKEITSLWHNLIIHNAAYQQDALSWEIQPGLPPVHLEAGTLLLEYFSLGNNLVVFLVYPEDQAGTGRVEAVRLPASVPEVERLVQLFHLNLRTVPVSSLQARPFLETNAQKLLNQLYEILIAPIARSLPGHPHLIIVPHGAMHYLPFHALYDGQHYLLETHTVRYLPTAALANRKAEVVAGSRSMLAIGHSFQGFLPFALEEARSVAELWGETAFLEADARLEHLRHIYGDYRLIHVACHGDFRPDNPLFSGLSLEDGWLTTLDIFNIRLNASLVTFSACQTGSGVIGGGDDLAGLMRALLSTGAASLVLSQWAVSDRSTAQLMDRFYRALARGEDKAMALRSAQLFLLNDGDQADQSLRHPYFWAPFFLVGDGGRL